MNVLVSVFKQDKSLKKSVRFGIGSADDIWKLACAQLTDIFLYRNPPKITLKNIKYRNIKNNNVKYKYVSPNSLSNT